MSALDATLVAFLLSVVAGVVGSLLGLGGGLIVVPTLTLLLGIDIRHAIGASLVSIIATSSGAAAAYVRDRLANVRVAMFLELGTTTGALGGAFLAGVVPVQALQVVFGVLLAVSAVAMLRNRHEARGTAPADPWSDRLGLHGSLRDPATGTDAPYRVARAPLGLGLMVVAGALSGMLGIGAGVLKVPALDLGMRLPMKASSATSNLMIGVTAAASAGVWLARGDIHPLVTAPVASGVLVGAWAGSRMLPHVNARALRLVFVVLLVFVSGQMLWKGLA